MIDKRGREAFPLDIHQDLPHNCQDQASIRDKVEQKKEKDQQALNCSEFSLELAVVVLS